MRSHIVRTLSVATVAVLLASSLQAQGRGHGNGRSHANKGNQGAANQSVIRDRDDRDRDDRDRDANDRNRGVYGGADGNRGVYGDRTVYGNGTKVPPGLAKKPGQMPPGQYKKRYGTSQGASVLGDILRRRGYSVLRVAPSGDSRYVYYREGDGDIRRAIVSPGSDRLSFRNVPSLVLQDVLARLY
jgi:hypothetical protein